MMTTSEKKHGFLIYGICIASIAASCDPGDPPQIRQEQHRLDFLCGSAVQPAITPAGASVLIDKNTSTKFGTGNNNWQFVTIDLGCAATISGMRRNMVKDQPAATRTNQGEQWQYSTNGTTWTSLTGPTTFGWSSYVNYGANLHAWHSTPYGWSRWLRPTSPITARYLRYHWDGNQDSVTEVEVDSRTITTQRVAINNTSAWDVINSDETTGLETGYLDWQYVTIDLGRTVQLSRLRRHMSGSGNRAWDGEAWTVSSDGTTYNYLTAADVTGWESYINYGASNNAWRSVPYGWSAWLALGSPRYVRYLRYHWDGNADRLNEIEFQEVLTGTDPNYDFLWTSGGFTPSVPDYSGFNPAPSMWTIMSNPQTGFTGFYEGEIWSNVGGGQRSQVSAVLLSSASGEVRGTIDFSQGLTAVYLDGLFCSNKIIPEGTRLAVRMTPWTNDGRFSETPLLSDYLYASGSTSRPVSGFGVDGTATFNLYAQLSLTELGSNSPRSELVVYVEYDTPCTDGPPLYLFLTRNSPAFPVGEQVLRKMVGL
jgi:hypothetical protein